MNAGRRRAVLLLGTIGTFGAALVGLYALTGVWPASDVADRWAVAIAFAVAASGAVDKALSPWADHAPPAATPPDGDPPDPPPDSSDPPPEPSGGRGWWAHDRVRTAVVTAAVTAAAGGIVYGVLAAKARHDDAALASDRNCFEATRATVIAANRAA
ncbi:hypothetical protein ACFYR1_10265 [Streptomyces canus]|uniref:hypothetical protein n=1 Tax=Streptomyces canus TaxID=58343 RepID=UPI003674D556